MVVLVGRGTPSSGNNFQKALEKVQETPQCDNATPRKALPQPQQLMESEITLPFPHLMQILPSKSLISHFSKQWPSKILGLLRQWVLHPIHKMFSPAWDTIPATSFGRSSILALAEKGEEKGIHNNFWVVLIIWYLFTIFILASHKTHLPILTGSHHTRI